MLCPGIVIVTYNEIKRLKAAFEKQSDEEFTITKDQFKEVRT